MQACTDGLPNHICKSINPSSPYTTTSLNTPTTTSIISTTPSPYQSTSPSPTPSGDEEPSSSSIGAKVIVGIIAGTIVVLGTVVYGVYYYFFKSPQIIKKVPQSGAKPEAGLFAEPSLILRQAGLLSNKYCSVRATDI